MVGSARGPVAGVVLALLLATPGLAQAGGDSASWADAVPADRGDAVRVYTNADLEKYAVYAGRPEPEPVAAESWDAVQEFLDRQHRRIDADRRHELERARLDRLSEPVIAVPRYVPPFGLRPFFPGFRHLHGFGRHAHRPPEPPRLPHGDGRGIHGPGHGRFSDLKGEDAVPGPPAHRPHNGSRVGPARPAPQRRSRH